MELTALPKYQPRSFVPVNADLTDLDTIRTLYEQLEKKEIGSAKDLEQWLLNRSEVDAAFSQAGSILYIKMTCHTDDPAIAGAYTQFIEKVVPAVKPVNDRLNHKYLQHISIYPLDATRYEVYDKSVKADIELFVDVNIPLQTQVELLSQEYQAVSGAMTVNFDGQERTMPQMGKYLQETDRTLRERAWRASAERRTKEKDKFEEIFDKMFDIRNNIARNAGYPHFTAYQFKAYHRFDYTPADCQQYHETVEELIVPLNGAILKKRSLQMGLTSLKPWDTAVDASGKEALSPFKDSEELIKKTGSIFNRLDPDFGAQFEDMRQLGLLDLSSRKGKAPGGYQNTLSEARKPFIFMNAVGIDDDIRTLLHEGGHAFHAIAAAREPLLDYRHAPMEFCEVASMAMELLGGEYLSEFYNPADLKRSNREHLEGIIQTLAWVANIDAFQHWLYAHPDHSRVERKEAWLSFYEQFGGKFIDWDGLSQIKSYLWHRQLHVFEVPFYYIEYGIAQLGALQVWLSARKNPAKALSDYKNALALGGSRPVKELYAKAGIKFDFSRETIKPLIEAVSEEWEKLS